MPVVSSALHDRVLAAVLEAGVDLDDVSPALRAVPAAEPDKLSSFLAEHYPGRAILTGTLDRRLLLLGPAAAASAEAGAAGPPQRWIAADLSGRPHTDRAWPAWTDDRLVLHAPARWISAATLASGALTRLTRPRVLLAALYHREHFPLPRFPLGISDLARAARATLTGEVRLMDMQLGVDLPDLLAAATGAGADVGERVDVVGISATFGQHDLLTALLDTLASAHPRPLVLAGGSLTARNERLLLERYPWLLVSRGAGEATITDVLGYFHGDLTLEQVRGVGYRGAPRGGGLTVGFRRTSTVTNRAQTDILPELDLLAETFVRRGVAQLEASRGCTNACSFCPRGHKGSWAGAHADDLRWITAEIATVFDRHPDISRTVYLVDEEFIGRGPDAPERALAVADVLHGQRLGWETSCRVDQIVATDTSDRAWHVARAHLWRELGSRGLRRCLFGIESGVTSILTRFNKETHAEQNALAVRTLSALGVPTRFTYITFDQLMSADELAATTAFQGRTDLLLRPLPHLGVDAIIDGVRDESFVAAHATGRPFYSAISYLLVSMECLTGAAYTKRVQEAGLAVGSTSLMGRLDAEFADWRIGRCSHHAQLWVDRNFALDYTLKSLEKVLDGRPRTEVRAARVVLKAAAFELLRGMVDLLDQFPSQPAEPDSTVRLDSALRDQREHTLRGLRNRLDVVVAQLSRHLPADDATTLRYQHDRWRDADSWQLINAADPCGT